MDMATIEAAEALAPSHEALLGLAERYGTREIVVASAFLDLPEPAVRDDLDVNAAGVSDASDAPVGGDAAETGVSNSRRVRGPVEGAILQLTIHRVGATTQSTTSELLRGAQSESRESLLARAVQRIVAHVESGWKQANILRFGRESEMQIMVPLNSLADWVETRRQLRELAMINGT